MIFVTVGTTHFDELIQAVDKWNNLNPEIKVLCQIGSGKYIPKTSNYIRFDKSLDKYIDDADIVVTHGGATVIDLIRKKKRFFACANTALSGDHQSIMLKTLSEFCNIVWTNNTSDISNLLDSFLRSEASSGVVNWDGPSLKFDLIDYING